MFITESLTKLPPHCEGFDCEVNLKKGSIQPFDKVYNLSKEERYQLNLYVQENLDKGFIRVLSLLANSPIFMLRSKVNLTALVLIADC